jgi:DNA-binding FadR family transcriptional regulator
MSNEDHAIQPASGGTSGALDVERDSDVPISTQIYWQLAYQIDSGRLLPGSRLPPEHDPRGLSTVGRRRVRQ